MSKINFGIIGLGDIGRGHLKCLLNCKEAHVVGLCDIEPRRLDQVGFFGIKKEDIRNIPFFTGYRKLLDLKNLDAVIIGVPGYLHAQIALDVLSAGKHLLLEKPLAHTLEDAKKIKSAAQKSKSVVQVGLVYRYSPFYRKMADVIRSQILGRVELMWCKEYREPFPQMDWFYDKNKSGGAIVEKNTHHFDVFQWMIGAKAKKVSAFGGQNVIKFGEKHLIQCAYCAEPPKVIDTSSIHDNAFVNIEYENGARANLGLCLFLKPGSISPNYLEIGAIGSKGIELLSNQETGLLKIYSSEKKENQDLSMKLTGREFGHVGAMEEHVEFIECIRSGKKPVADIEIAWQSLLVALAAQKSIEEERVVYIGELERYQVP